MGEIRNARCLLLQWQWIQYGDQQVDPICRSLTGSITPITTWILYADQQVDPLGRSLTVEYYNRQLHPVEAKRIEKIAGEYAEKRGISIDKAIAELTQQVEQNIDTAWNKRLGSDNPTAQAFLKENGLGQPLVDPATGQTYQLFTADAAQRDNHAQFAQYSKSDPLVRKELDLAMSKAYLPSDAQAIKAPMTGSDMALNDAARDFANMKAQPASVQWSVLAELRGTRVVVMQQYAGLSDELKNLPLTPDNAQRRTDLTIQLDSLGQRDAALLGATKQQILDMGAAGSANPLNQRETYEGMGEALGLARLSGKGISNASINARIDLLKGAVVEAQAASAAEKAVAQTKIENNFYRDGGVVELGSSKVITNPNEAFFWSGRTDGVGGIDAAKSIANQYKGQTLEQLLESRKITMPAYDPTVPSSVKAWQDLSSELAKNASGEVRAVLGSKIRPQNIWETYELPELMRNPAVTRIIAIDPKTGIERIIFQKGR